MKQATINLYSFSELSDEAKRKALDEHLEFLNSFQNTVNEFENITDEDVVESIEINDYLFFFSGELAPCTCYTGKHPRSGQEELTIGGEAFNII